jgi:hypothetical protein
MSLWLVGGTAEKPPDVRGHTDRSSVKDCTGVFYSLLRYSTFEFKVRRHNPKAMRDRELLEWITQVNVIE